jgi:hypothetical protein
VATRFTPQVSTNASAPRIIVRVQPRLLNDVLTITLRDQGHDVVVYSEDLPADANGTEQPFDLAVVSEVLASDVVADVTIVLDEDGGGVTVIGEADERELAADDRLGGLLRIIQSVLHGRTAEL